MKIKPTSWYVFCFYDGDPEKIEIDKWHQGFLDQGMFDELPASNSISLPLFSDRNY